MFFVDIEFFFAFLCSSFFVAILLLWAYYDRREKILIDNDRFRPLFFCVKCGELYSKKRMRETATCPKCGFKNSRLKF